MSSKEKQSEKLVESIRKSKAGGTLNRDSRASARDRNKQKAGSVRVKKDQAMVSNSYASGSRVWPD